MPRQSRIDAPNAVHHIISRGIERKNIFFDEEDRDKFLTRFGNLIQESQTTCYAWVLMPNHFHLLLRTGNTPLPTVMSRLLTGHAVAFNKRHKRHGHLFQNRYKSILCQEDRYLLELVRYIHLNPLRARLVESYDALGRYPYCGHATIKGFNPCSWQDREYILSLFAETEALAKRRYSMFVKDGISEEERDDLMGGGLIRSRGGWEAVKKQKEGGSAQMGDERILGDGSFVKRVLVKADEVKRLKSQISDSQPPIEEVASISAKLFGVHPDTIFRKTKQRQVVKARNLFCHWCVNDLHRTMTELSKLLGISIAAVSKSTRKGTELAKENGLSIENEKLKS